MAKKQLKIKIKPDGTIDMETLGIKGKKCEDYLPLIKKLVKAKITEIKHSKDFYDEINTSINTNNEQFINENL